MSAVFMITSAHISHNTLDGCYNRLQLQYSSIASAGVRQVLLSGIKPNNMEVILATGLLLYTEAWASPSQSSVTAHGSKHATETDFLIPLGIRLRRILSQATQDHLLRSSIFGSAIMYSPKVELLRAVKHTELAEKFRVEFSREYQRIWPVHKDQSTNQYELYMVECERLLPVLTVLTLVESEFALHYVDGALVRYLYSWPMMITPGFALLIENRAPCADLLLWHFYTTVQSTPTRLQWWASKRVAAMVSVLEDTLQQQGIWPRSPLQDSRMLLASNLWPDYEKIQMLSQGT